MTIEDAARALLEAEDARRAALNGEGHPGEDHDRWICPGGHDLGNGVTVHDIIGDCSACGGAQYGADYQVNGALGDLREALGGTRFPWETYS